MTHPAGRPLKFNSTKDLQKKCDEYLAKCELEGERPLVSELALSLGFVSRQSVYDYIHRDNEFSYPLKKVQYYQELWLEKNLTKSHNSTGIIFALKNCGWSDQRKIEHSTGNLDSLKRIADDIGDVGEY